MQFRDDAAHAPTIDGGREHETIRRARAEHHGEELGWGVQRRPTDLERRSVVGLH